MFLLNVLPVVRGSICWMSTVCESLFGAHRRQICRGIITWELIIITWEVIAHRRQICGGIITWEEHIIHLSILSCPSELVFFVLFLFYFMYLIYSSQGFHQRLHLKNRNKAKVTPQLKIQSPKQT